MSGGTSNALPFRRLSYPRIVGGTDRVTPGEFLQFQIAWVGTDTPEPLRWSATSGQVTTDGLWTAGPVADTPATISACLTDGSRCAYRNVIVQPLRIEAPRQILATGEIVQLRARQGSASVAATWRILSGGGTISPFGVYQASQDAADTGPVRIQAFYRGTAEIEVAVGGAAPGLVWRSAVPGAGPGSGTSNVFARAAWLVGDLLIVHCSSQPFVSLRNDFWLDVYDLTQPDSPRWLQSVDAPESGELSVKDGVVVIRYNPNSPSYGSLDIEAVYDVTGGNVSLDSAQTAQDTHAWVLNLKPASLVEQDAYRQEVARFALDANWPSNSLADFTVFGSRLFTAIIDSSDFFAPKTTAYWFDLNGGSGQLSGQAGCRRNGLGGKRQIPGLIQVCSDLLDIRSSDVIPVSLQPDAGMQSADGDFLLASAIFGQDSYVYDLSVRGSAWLRDSFEGRGGVIRNGYVYRANGLGGLEVYDVRLAGGPRWQNAAGPDFYPADMAVHGDRLYAAGFSPTPGIAQMKVFDLSSGSLQAISSFSDFRQGEAVFRLLVRDGAIYLGTDRRLLTLAPDTLQKTASLDGAVTAIAAQNNWLYAALYSPNGQATLSILDVTNPLDPSVVTTVPLPNYATRIAAKGAVLALTDIRGVRFFDISDPAHPYLVSSMPVNSELATDCLLFDSYAYVLFPKIGLAVLDLTDLTHPSVLQVVDLEAWPTPYKPLANVLAAGPGRVYVGTRNAFGAVFVIDSHKPKEPRVTGIVQTAEAICTDVAAIAAGRSSLFVASPALIQFDATLPDNRFLRLIPAGAPLPQISSICSSF